MPVGDCRLEVIALRGHTPGSVALLYSDPDGHPHLFTGDSLFPGGPGKTADPGSLLVADGRPGEPGVRRAAGRHLGLSRPRRRHHPRRRTAAPGGVASPRLVAEADDDDRPTPTVDPVGTAGPGTARRSDRGRSRRARRACPTTRRSGPQSGGPRSRSGPAARRRCRPPSDWPPRATAPVVPRGAGTGLSGGANAVDGCLVLDVSRMNAILDVDPDNLTCVVATRRRQRRPEGAPWRAGPVVSAGPGERPVVDDRRQRRHERRRAVLPEVRRHPGLRARSARGRRRPRRLRHGRPAGPAHDQGCRGLRHGRVDGRLGGHPRRGHGGDAATAARPARHAAHRGRCLRVAGRGRRGGRARHQTRPDPVRPGTARPDLPAGGGGLEAPGHRGGRGRPAAGQGRHAGRCGRCRG